MGRLCRGLIGGLSLLTACVAFAQEQEPEAKGEKPAAPAAADKPLLVLDVGGHTAPVRKVLFSRDDKQVITVSQDKTIRFWDVATGKTVRVLRPPAGDGEAGELFTGALSPDGKTLAVAGWGLRIDGKRVAGIYLINLSDGTLRTLVGHTDSVNAVVFSPDGKLLASCSDDKTARIWDLAEGKGLYVLEGHTEAVLGVAFSPRGDRLVTVSRDTTGRIWSVRTGMQEAVSEHRRGRGHLSLVAWSPDGKAIVVGGPRDQIMHGLEWWDTSAMPLKRRPVNLVGRPPDRKPPLPDSLVGFQESPDSKENPELVYNWRAAEERGKWSFGVSFLDHEKEWSRQVFTVSEGSAPTVICTALSSDRKLGATSGGDKNQIYLWTTDKGELLHRMESPGQPPFSVAWGKDADNKTTVAWGVADRPGDHKPPLSAAFHFTDLTLSAGPDQAKFRGNVRELGRVSLILRKQGKEVSVITPRGQATLEVHNNNEDTFTLLTHDTLMIAEGNALVLYDFHKGLRPANHAWIGPKSDRLRRFAPHGGHIRAVAPSPDGRFVVSVSADQTVRITNVEDPDNPLVSLFVSGKEWVAWTPQGYYAASLGGERLMGWQVNNGPDKLASFYPASRFRALLYRPDVISRLLTEGSVAKALAAADKEKGVVKSEVVEVEEVLPPAVTLTAPKLKGGKTADSAVEVVATATGRGKHPVTSLQLLLDGRPYEGGKGLRKVEAKPGAAVTEKWTVELPPGEHTLRAMARSEASMGLSEDLVVEYEKPVPRPHLYLLAVGIDAYPAPVPKLNCAVADARELQKTFQERSKDLFEVDYRLLTDKEATRADILKGLAWLKANMKPHDQAVIFYAGHGEQDGKSFYLLPQDVNVAQLPATGISGDLLKQHLADLPGKVLLILDACHSGAIGKAITEISRDLADDDCGVVVMCAALGREKAGEADGHGFFCRAMIEALEGKGAKNKADGCVYQHHVEQYVIDRVEELSKKEQHPTTAKPTLPPFPLARP